MPGQIRLSSDTLISSALCSKLIRTSFTSSSGKIKGISSFFSLSQEWPAGLLALSFHHRVQRFQLDTFESGLVFNINYES